MLKRVGLNKNPVVFWGGGAPSVLEPVGYFYEFFPGGCVPGTGSETHVPRNSRSGRFSAVQLRNLRTMGALPEGKVAKVGMRARGGDGSDGSGFPVVGSESRGGRRRTLRACKKTNNRGRSGLSESETMRVHGQSRPQRSRRESRPEPDGDGRPGEAPGPIRNEQVAGRHRRADILALGHKKHDNAIKPR